MPNWCSNQITITGAPAQIRELLDAARPKDKAKEEVFSLEAIDPVPASLHVTAGSDEVHYEVYYGDWRSVANYAYVKKDCGEVRSRDELIGYFKSRNPGKDLQVIADTYRKNLEEHGHRTWYSWCIQNWGTKWDINAHYSYDEGSDFLSFYFESAWSPPVEAFEYISAKFPELEFVLEYFEEGADFIGKNVIQGGETLALDEGCCSCAEDLERFDFAPEPWEDEDWDEEE